MKTLLNYRYHISHKYYHDPFHHHKQHTLQSVGVYYFSAAVIY